MWIFWKMFCSRNPWKGEKSSDKDIFHSFHVLHRGVMRIQMLVNFIDWHSKSAMCKVRTTGPCLREYIFLETWSKNVLLTDTTNKYYLSWVLFWSLTSVLLGFVKKSRFPRIFSCRFNDLIDQLFLDLSWTFQVFCFSGKYW